METTDRVVKYYIFIGVSVEGKYRYKSIPSMDVNNGSSITSVSGVGSVVFDGRLFKRNNNIGVIFKVEESNEGKTTHFGKDDFPVGYWKNLNDSAGWSLEHNAAETKRKLIKDGKNNELRELLAPLKLKYREASPALRAAILAEIIENITG